MRTISTSNVKSNVPRRPFILDNLYARYPWISRYARIWMTILLLITDLTSILLAWGLAIFLRVIVAGDIRLEPLIRLIPFTLLFLLVYSGRGLYPSIGINPVEELKRLSSSTTIVFLGLTAFAFILRSPNIYSRAVFGLSWFFALLLLPLGRNLLRAVGVRLQLWGEPVAIIGKDSDVDSLINYLRDNPKTGLRPVVIFAQSKSLPVTTDIPIYSDEVISQVCSKRLIQSALVVSQGINGADNDVIENYENIFRRIILVDSQPSSYLLWVSLKNLGDMLGLEIQYNLLNNWSQFLKRLIDIIISSFVMIFFFPFFALLTIIIKLDSSGSAFYYQDRIGHDGKLFRMIKFRTMHRDADQMLEAYLNDHPEQVDQWNEYQKLQDDPRVTRVGKYLRRFSIDEIPQVMNVLRGEMSLVGPRPFFPDQKEMYGPAYAHYIRVHPGVTGMWQISGRNNTPFQERAQWDEYYVRNWSIWLDLYILARTFGVVISRKGAF